MRLIFVLFLSLICFSNGSDINIREGMKVYGTPLNNNKTIICDKYYYEAETAIVNMLVEYFKRAVQNVDRNSVDIQPLKSLLSDSFEGYLFTLGNYSSSFDTNGLFWFMRYLHINNYVQKSEFLIDNVRSNVYISDICVEGRIVNSKQITTSTFTFRVVREQGMYVFKQMTENRKENV